MDGRVEMLHKAAEYITSRMEKTPEIGMILGSGLGVLGNEVEDPVVIKYEDIPSFPRSTVTGHAGQMVIGTLEGKNVLVMQGRFHYYEGYSMDTVVFPVRVMKLLGIEKFLVTNASGGVNTSYKPGDLMIISDHIKLGLDNPLRGANMESFGLRFPDMSDGYAKSLRVLAKKAGEELGISLKEGVYALMGGPNYETPAEIRMLRTLGADAVGMSTVPEVLTAVHAGMKVLGISCITNMAAGVLDQPLEHAEVMETAERVRENFTALVRRVISKWD